MEESRWSVDTGLVGRAHGVEVVVDAILDSPSGRSLFSFSCVGSWVRTQVYRLGSKTAPSFSLFCFQKRILQSCGILVVGREICIDTLIYLFQKIILWVPAGTQHFCVQDYGGSETQSAEVISPLTL